MMDADALGDRMKMYEGLAMPERFLPGLPVIARLDGRGFSRFTRGLKRPYDERMSGMMATLTKYLVEETQPTIGYCQSDEISLCYYTPDPEHQQPFFDGKPQKIISTLAAMASVYFYELCQNHLPANYAKRYPTFDCRAFTVPSTAEAANAFLWRELDATKNSISMAARTVCSHKELHKKNGKEMQEMLFQKGINWNDYPAFFKRGTYVQRRHVERTFTPEELADLPEKHHARLNPGMAFVRHEVQYLDMPPLLKVTNRADVVCLGHEPVGEA